MACVEHPVRGAFTALYGTVSSAAWYSTWCAALAVGAVRSTAQRNRFSVRCLPPEGRQRRSLRALSRLALSLLSLASQPP